MGRSDALVVTAQPGWRSGVGICGFLLPVAEGVLEGALPVPGSIPAPGTATDSSSMLALRIVLYILICV